MDWEAIEGAAVEEGTVVLETQMLELTTGRLEDAFETAYPEVDLQWRTISAAEAQPVIDAERQAGRQRVDVYTTDGGDWLQSQADEGFLARFVGPSFDSPQFDRERWLHDFWVDTTSNTGVWTWNTAVCPEPIASDGITSWEDYLDPSLKDGQIIVDPDPSVALVVADFYRLVESQAGEDFLERLAEQNPKFGLAGNDTLASLAAGEAYTATYTQAAAVEEAIWQGAPLDYNLPTEGGWAGFQVTAVFADAPHPNAAQVFANFMLSPTGQEALAQNAVSVLPGIPGVAAQPDQVVPRQFVTVAESEAFQQRFDDIFRS